MFTNQEIQDGEFNMTAVWNSRRNFKPCDIITPRGGPQRKTILNVLVTFQVYYPSFDTLGVTEMRQNPHLLQPPLQLNSRKPTKKPVLDRANLFTYLNSL